MAPQPTVTQHWRRALEGRASEELFTLAEQVADLVKQPGWQGVMGLIAEARESLSSAMVNQSGKWELPMFSRTAGHIAGLDELGNAVDAIEKAAASRRQKLETAARAESPDAEEVAT